VLVRTADGEDELALLEGTAPDLTVIARAQVHGEPGAETSFPARAASLALAPTKCALRVLQRRGDKHSDEGAVARVILFLRQGAALQPILRREIDVTPHVDDPEEAADVECAGGFTQGLCDLHGETSVFYCRDCEGNGVVEQTSYRWDGARYRKTRGSKSR
jgi:hypothetical protein